MNTGECMEYAQRLCDAQTAADRNAARADLRAAIDAAVAAERQRCASVVRYWLTGHAPATGTYEARCLDHVLDGRQAPSGWTERA